MSTRVHYVLFESPGTLFHETSRLPIPSWDIAEAIKLASSITERHGAKPFAFRFVTDLEADPIDDGEGGKLKVTPRQVDKSGRHFLGGVVKRFEDIPDTRENSILRSNMSCNGYALVIENRNSYLSVQPFEADDCLVDVATAAVVTRGRDPDLAAYRKAKEIEWDRSTR